MKKFLKKLTDAGVEIKESSFVGALYITLRIPIADLTEEEKCGGSWVSYPQRKTVEATGLLWLRRKHWEVHRSSCEWRERLVALLRKFAPKGWREYRLPSFSDICKNPENLVGLYGPPSDA